MSVRETTPAIFWKFQNSPGAYAPEGFEVNFLGGLTRDTFGDFRTGLVSGIPSPNEEVFELACLLEAVRDAGDTFTFVEAGAGYGRWSCFAALAARRLAKRYALHLIEAEPQHVDWIPIHMADNDIAACRYQVHQVAIGAATGTTPFIVVMPDAALTPRSWYGQAVLDPTSAHALKPTDSEYFGRILRMHPGGWGTIDVEAKPLYEILHAVAHIDLIDMDIQGAETNAIEASIDFLNARARRIYIGTHSRKIEIRLRAMLSSSGWECRIDFECGKEAQTDLGPIKFGDGAQFWVNPRFHSRISR